MMTLMVTVEFHDGEKLVLECVDETEPFKYDTRLEMFCAKTEKSEEYIPRESVRRVSIAK